MLYETQYLLGGTTTSSQPQRNGTRIDARQEHTLTIGAEWLVRRAVLLLLPFSNLKKAQLVVADRLLKGEMDGPTAKTQMTELKMTSTYQRQPIDPETVTKAFVFRFCDSEACLFVRRSMEPCISIPQTQSPRLLEVIGSKLCQWYGQPGLTRVVTTTPYEIQLHKSILMPFLLEYMCASIQKRPQAVALCEYMTYHIGWANCRQFTEPYNRKYILYRILKGLKRI